VLPGFKYFHLMRRVTLNPVAATRVMKVIPLQRRRKIYISFTIGMMKSVFSAWRTDDAFKEALGGTSITAFLSTMVDSALVLRCTHRSAYYDGLFTATVQPSTLPETGDTSRWWPYVAGKVLVCIEQFYFSCSKAATFEQTARWKKQASALTPMSIILQKTIDGNLLFIKSLLS